MVIGNKMNQLIIPDRTIVDLVAVTQFTRLDVSNAYSVVYASAPNDPFGSGSTPPRGFAEWMNFYSKYLVLHCSIKIQLMNISTGSIAPLNGIWFAVYPSLATDAIVDTYAEAIQQRFSKNTMCGGVAGMNIKTLSHNFSSRKIIGRPLFDDSYSGTVSSAPTINWYWHIVFGALIDNYAMDYPDVGICTSVKFKIMFYSTKSLADDALTGLKRINLASGHLSTSSNQQLSSIDELKDELDDDDVLVETDSVMPSSHQDLPLPKQDI